MRALALAAAIVASAFVNAAEPYPAKVIRMIVPYSPGGTGDNIGRAVGAKLGELLGQQVIIDNRRGGRQHRRGSDCTRRARRLHRGDGGDEPREQPGAAAQDAVRSLKDLVPVSGCCEVPMIVVVHPSLPVKNIKEFVAYAKRIPAS